MYDKNNIIKNTNDMYNLYLHIISEDLNMNKQPIKFYFYEITSTEEEEKNIIEEIIKFDFKEVYSSTSTTSNICHEISIDKINTYYYFGQITHSKTPEEYYGKLKNEKQVQELITDVDLVGEKKSIAYFGFTILENKIILISQIGFQLAGIGFIKEYLINKLNIKIKSKPMTSSRIKEIESYLNKKLKSIDIRFKNDISLSEETKKDAEKIMETFNCPYEYYISIKISYGLRKSKDNTPTFRQMIEKFLNGNLNKFIESGLDLPSLLEKFNVELFDNDSDIKQIIKEDILDKFEREIIFLDPSNIDNKNLIKKILCDKLNEKLELNLDNGDDN